MKKVIVLLSFVCTVLLGDELEIAAKAYEAGDYQKAFKYSKITCDSGEYRGCSGLGILYANGQGARQSYSMAKEYYGKACDLGYQKGCDVFADLNQKGY